MPKKEQVPRVGYENMSASGRAGFRPPKRLGTDIRVWSLTCADLRLLRLRPREDGVRGAQAHPSALEDAGLPACVLPLRRSSI